MWRHHKHWNLTSLGPIPSPESKLFDGLCFLLTNTEPRWKRPQSWQYERCQDTRHSSSDEDDEYGTDTEFCSQPFNKERLKEQLEAGGGTVYSHFDDVPKSKYSVCKLIASRPCLTAKYIQCLAADIRALSHAWVIMSCTQNRILDYDAYILPAGWSILKKRYVNWVPSSGKRNTSFFKDKVILLCSDEDTFLKFWERVCIFTGATTRVVNKEDLNMTDAVVLVTELDCPREVHKKADQDNIPLVFTTWVVQCLIEARLIAPTSHKKFMYAKPK